MSPRIFWFVLGGASAAWWIKKHDDCERRITDGRLGGEEPSPPHCMKHSWYWRHRQSWGDRQVPAAAVDPDKPQPPFNPHAPGTLDSSISDFDGSEASERLVGAVRTGIRSVMDTMVNIEKAFKEERAEMLQRRQEEQAAAPNHPQAAVQAQPPAFSAGARAVSATEKSIVPPKYSTPGTSPVSSEQQTMSQILVALDKLNAKLDGIRPSGNGSGEPPRLV